MPDVEMHPDWNRERCLANLADLDRRIQSLRDRAEWLRAKAHQADAEANLTELQRRNFTAMIQEPSKVLDRRPGSMQEVPDA